MLLLPRGFVFVHVLPARNLHGQRQRHHRRLLRPVADTHTFANLTAKPEPKPSANCQAHANADARPHSDANSNPFPRSDRVAFPRSNASPCPSTFPSSDPFSNPRAHRIAHAHSLECPHSASFSGAHRTPDFGALPSTFSSSFPRGSLTLLHQLLAHK
jgi:hypothetical protein